ncbi:MAG: hypothetical protein K0S11_1368 [Gammaproteobacteria bacterium]|jgi:hypothetical protein|nr:hypothetical protein [Gammaproteobacteria bacterium]
MKTRALILSTVLLSHMAYAQQAILLVHNDTGPWYGGGIASILFKVTCINPDQDERRIDSYFGSKIRCKENEQLKYLITYSGPIREGTAKNCDGIVEPGETKHFKLVGTLVIWPECKPISP